MFTAWRSSFIGFTLLIAFAIVNLPSLVAAQGNRCHLLNNEELEGSYGRYLSDRRYTYQGSAENTPSHAETRAGRHPVRFPIQYTRHLDHSLETRRFADLDCSGHGGPLPTGCLNGFMDVGAPRRQ